MGFRSVLDAKPEIQRQRAFNFAGRAANQKKY